MLVPAVLAFMVVPDWRRASCVAISMAAALIAVAVFSPVLIWNDMHDWATFRFQSCALPRRHGSSLRTFGDFIGLQFGLVGSSCAGGVVGVALTAWRGYREREPVAILLSTAVSCLRLFPL